MSMYFTIISSTTLTPHLGQGKWGKIMMMYDEQEVEDDPDENNEEEEEDNDKYFTSSFSPSTAGCQTKAAECHQYPSHPEGFAR